MFRKPDEAGGPGHSASLGGVAAAMRAALTDAEAVLRDDPAEAERRAKAVSALVRAARDVAELETFARAQPTEDNEEARRAELRRRLALFVEHAQTDAPDAVLERIIAQGSPE